MSGWKSHFQHTQSYLPSLNVIRDPLIKKKAEQSVNDSRHCTFSFTTVSHRSIWMASSSPSHLIYMWPLCHVTLPSSDVAVGLLEIFRDISFYTCCYVHIWLVALLDFDLQQQQQQQHMHAWHDIHMIVSTDPFNKRTTIFYNLPTLPSFKVQNNYVNIYKCVKYNQLQDLWVTDI